MAILTHEAELTRLAWSEYAERLHGLEGADYDHAEQEAWDRLQESLEAAGRGSRLPSEPIE